MISIIHPSRSRAQKSFDTYQKWLVRAQGTPFEWVLSLDDDDPQLPLYIELYGNKSVKIYTEKNKTAVQAINHGAKFTVGDIIMVVSDDTDCPNGWASSIGSLYPGPGEWIMKLDDGIQPWMITMPVMSRAYYERFGYIYYPKYKHMFCDTELTCVADILGKKVIRKGLMFRHQHYSMTHEQPDALNKRNDSTWNQGEKLFIERYKKNFGLKEKGYIQDKHMVHWLEQKMGKAIS